MREVDGLHAELVEEDPHKLRLRAGVEDARDGQLQVVVLGVYPQVGEGLLQET